VSFSGKAMKAEYDLSTMKSRRNPYAIDSERCIHEAVRAKPVEELCFDSLGMKDIRILIFGLTRIG